MFSHDGKSNLLLSMLSASDQNVLVSRGMVVDLALGTDLAIAGEPIAYCWFPYDSLVSVIASDGDGNEAEIGIIGADGMVNSGVLVGSRQSPMRALVQIPGSALRVDARAIRAAAAASPDCMRLMLAYNHALSVQAAFSALAYAQYSIEKRLARWTLMCADRVGENRVDLTHDALSIMLGVRRAGVTVALHNLVKKGAITTRRGGLSITDRPVLLQIAGAGYGMAEAEYQRIVVTERALPGA